MWCDNCEKEPCVCQRQLVVRPEREVKQRYMFKKCENADCSVMIGWTIGARQGMAQCRWCQDGQAHWQRQWMEYAQ